MAWLRPGDKPLSELMMVSLLTHICVTRPQWVNGMYWCLYIEDSSQNYGFLWYNKQVSKAWMYNHIPQFMWDIITCPWASYLLLAHMFSYVQYKALDITTQQRFLRQFLIRNGTSHIQLRQDVPIIQPSHYNTDNFLQTTLHLRALHDGQLWVVFCEFKYFAFIFAVLNAVSMA